MKMQECTVRLKDGRTCALRSPEPSDAARRVDYLRIVNGETPFMARGSGEIGGELELIAEAIADQLEADDVLEIAAFDHGEMIACGGISPVARAYARRRHRAQMGVAVRKAYWNQGVATEILTRLIEAAPGMGFSQIELSVVADNERAQALYRKLGFREIGRIPNALQYEDGSRRDEIWMALLLEKS